MRKTILSLISLAAVLSMLTGCISSSKVKDAPQDSASAGIDETVQESIGKTIENISKDAAKKDTDKTVEEEEKDTTLKEEQKAVSKVVPNPPKKTPPKAPVASAKETPKAPVDKPTQDPYQTGGWDGTTYKSKHLGLKFQLTDGWDISTQEEMDRVMKLGADAITKDGETKVDLDRLKTIFNFMVKSQDGRSGIQIVSENLTFVNGGTSITAEQYIEYGLKVLNEKHNLGYVFGPVTKRKIAGKEYVVITGTVKDMIIQTMCYRKEGNFMNGITFTTAKGNEAEIEKQISAFSAY